MLKMVPNSISNIFMILCAILVHVNCGVTRVSRALYHLPGRPLIIKPYPGVENVQSDLYEVYMEPYTFDLRAVQAVALLAGEGESAVKGEVVFVQRHPPAGPILIKGNLTGLSPGKHGVHIRQSGDMRQGCDKLGDHFNPYLMQHGAPTDPMRHVGDLGNVEAKEGEETTSLHVIDPVMTLTGIRGVVGRAIVITEAEDDLGRAGTADSVTTGSSGKAIACGVIAFVR